MTNGAGKNRTGGVSVVICCYNSALRLPETLRHLSAQKLPVDFPWEVLVIDNASTDHTSEAALEIWNVLPSTNAGFRVIPEAKAGQMFARIRGAREAKYDCLVFCDDDNWLSDEYIFFAREMMERDAAVGAGGGQNAPATDATSYPDWFGEYRDKYALGIPAAESGDVTHKGFVLGAGMVTRTSLFLQAFDARYPSLLSGRNGEKLTTGDDFEYCKRVLLWDYRLQYDQRMKLTHFIPKERLTLAYRERLMNGIHEAGRVLSEYDAAIGVKRAVWHKNHFRLLLLAPFRILFARLGWSWRDATDERLKLFYISPVDWGGNPIRNAIKKFINHR